MNFLQKKQTEHKILFGLMLGDSEVDFKVMNDYPSELQCFIKIAFVKKDSPEKYKNYIKDNCDLILDLYNEDSFEIIEQILKQLIKIRNNIISN